MLTCSRLQQLWRGDNHRRLIRKLLEGRPEAMLRLDERIPGPITAAALLHLRLGELNQSSSPFARELLRRLLMSQRTDGSWQEGSERCESGGGGGGGGGGGVDPRLPPRHGGESGGGGGGGGSGGSGGGGGGGGRLSDAARRVMRTALVARALAECAAPLPGFVPARLGLSGIRLDMPAGQPAGECSRVGAALERAISFLAADQGVEGLWPGGDCDPAQARLVSGFVLLQLGRLGQFRDAVRIGDALAATEAARPNAIKHHRRATKHDPKATKPAPKAAQPDSELEIERLHEAVENRCGPLLRRAAAEGQPDSARWAMRRSAALCGAA